MPPLYLVDTSAWIFALRRNPNEAVRCRITELLDQDAVTTRGLIKLELPGGAATDQEFGRLQLRLDGLHHLSVEDAGWMASARLAFSLRRSSVAVSFKDVLLASVALRDGSVLPHADRDFDRIASPSALQVESLVSLIVPP